MKNRVLPVGLLSLFIGFGFLFISTITVAGGPGSSTSVTKEDPVTCKSVNDPLFLMRCNQVTGKIDPADVSKVRAQIEKLSAKSAATVDLNWIPVGPDNWAGKTRSIIFDKNDATYQTIYAGAVTGGIWKSTNLGLTWHQQNTSNNEVLRVTTLVQTPSGVIYAGTGEAYCGRSAFPGTGLYRSTDGANFDQIPSAQPVPNDINSEWAYITKLACDSRNGRLFAATNKGLKYSDNGDSWTSLINGNATEVVVGSDGTVLTTVDNAGYMAVGGDLSHFDTLSKGTATTLPTSDIIAALKFAIAPSDGNVMYASAIDRNTYKLYNIYVSTDKGVTWSIIFPANGSFNPYGSAGCYANTITVLPNDPTQVLIGGTDMWWGKKVMQNAFYSWDQVSFGITVSATTYTPIFVPSFHHEYLFRPNNSNEVAIATDQGIALGTIIGDSISFVTRVKDYITGSFNSVCMGRLKSEVLGGGTSIGTQIFGVNSTYPVNTPTEGTQIIYGLGVPTTAFINFPQNSGYCAWSMIAPKTIIMSGISSNPPFLRSEDLGTTFSPTFLRGSATDTASNINTRLVPKIPICLWESFNFENSRDSVKVYAKQVAIPVDSTIIVESSNAKFPFSYTTTAPIPLNDSLMVKDIVQSRFFMFGALSTTNTGIFMTKDALKFSVDPEWFQISKTGVSGRIDSITCIGVSNDVNYLWAGSTRGQLYRISNIALAHDSATADVNSPTCIVATEVFDATSFPFLLNRYITSVTVAADNNNFVLVTLGNYGNNDYVFITENALDSLPTFRPVQGNLPAMPVYTSVMELSNHNRVILGTDFGVYTTDDVSAGSVNWSYSSNGLGDVPVTQIKQQAINYYPIENYGALYLSSYGRGLFMDTTFYMPLGVAPSPVATAVPNALKVQPNPFRNYVDVTYNLGSAADVNVFVYDLTGRTVKFFNIGHKEKGEHITRIDLGSVPNGTYFIRINDAFGKVIKIN